MTRPRCSLAIAHAIAIAQLLGAGVCLAAESSAPTDLPVASLDSHGSSPTATNEGSQLGKAQGMVMLDYQLVPIPGNKPIDLVGLHLLNKVNDWLYLGVGAYAPLFRGEYGGFMAFDVAAHVQRQLFGPVFANAGMALGGGGGGKTVEQSKVLSGTGGYAKVYVGLGYRFDDFSVGANISSITFKDSAIDHTQLNVFVQVPFSYTVGSYARSGQRLAPADQARLAQEDDGQAVLTLGLDNYVQIDPEGLNKGTINVADLQFSYFIGENSYWFAQVGVGYHGRPLYNQFLGGLGYRTRVSERVSVYGQLGVGSGGYSPDTINTGPGLLVYPRISAEYRLGRHFGLSLTAGYLFAPKASSKNYTLGAALNYHLRALSPGARSTDGGGGSYFRGYRLNVFQQTELNVAFRDIPRGTVRLLSAQADGLVNDHLYIPLQVSVAYNAYLGYPGYGELLAGIGVQNKYTEDARAQFFGQLLLGTNVHGAILKTGLGVAYGLNDRLALYAQLGQTLALEKKNTFRANHLGIGLSYRFSVPSR